MDTNEHYPGLSAKLFTHPCAYHPKITVLRNISGALCLFLLIGASRAARFAEEEGVKTVVVVGLGVAGLELMSQLSKSKRFNVIGLEGANRVGGRVYTTSEGDEYGAAWIHGVETADHSEINPVYEMAQDVGCEYYETSKMKAISSDGTPLNCAPNLWDQMWGVLDRIKHSKESVSKAYLPNPSTDPNENIYSYIKEKYDELFEGIELQHRYSVLKAVREWQSYYAGIWDNLSVGSMAVDTEFQGSQYIITNGGYKRLLDKYTQDIVENGGEIRLNQIVREIKYSHDGAKIYIHGSEEAIEADAVVVTVSLGVLKSEAIRFDPPLPQYKQDSIRKLGFGVYDKIFVEFKSSIAEAEGGFWPADTDSILVVPYNDDDIHDTLNDDELEQLSRSSPTFSSSPGTPRPYTNRDPDHIGIEMVNLSHLAKKPKLVMLIYADVAVEMETFADDESRLIAYAQQKLDNAFNGRLVTEQRVPRITRAYATKWGQDPLVRGSFANIPVGSSGHDMRNLALPVEGRLMFAGEATFPVHYSTVHGALKSGRREFARLMQTFFPSEPTPFANLLQDEAI